MSGKFGAVITEEELKRRTSPVWPYKIFDPGKSVEAGEVEELMKGLVDIHTHGAPAGGWLAGRPTIVQTCLEASQKGFGALVFKDHNCMMNNVAQMVNEMLGLLKAEKEARGQTFTPIKMYGGLTLNYPVGGMNLTAVQTALDYGDCVEIWLPSLNAAHQHRAMEMPGGIEVSNGGEPTREMKDILDIMADYNKNGRGRRCALAACHVSNQEKFDILKYLKNRGMDLDVVIDHITQELTIASYEECIQMIGLGAYLQFAETSCVPWPGMQNWIIAFDYSFDLLRGLIKAKGSDHLVLCSDSGQPGHEFVPGWKSFLRTLLAQGISKEDIRNMSVTVPSKLIGR
jgi:hypothetical protein